MSPVTRRSPVRNALAVALLLMLIVLQGCSSVPERNPVPEQYAATATIDGIEHARFWGDEPPRWLKVDLKRSDDFYRENFPSTYGRPHSYLAISGGGSDGAFGAGLLNGWTASGKRPEFAIVTGVSTGALIAPFAFLGPAYDATIKEIYTEYETKDLIEMRAWLSILSSDSVADTAPLRAKIAEHVTEEMMAEIAAEGRKGRRLYIGTVNLDQARPVIWNVTAIADSGHPKSLELIHDIMMASASIPGAFPPMFFEVEAGGSTYDEMHVDGGTASQVFLYPLGLDWKKVLQALRVPGTPSVYVIRNSKLTPDPEAVDPWLPKIAGRSVSSLIRTQGIGDMYRMYIGAKRDGLDYNLAYVPREFEVKSQEIFDPVYMNALYELGYELAREGYPWQKAPPGTLVAN